MRSDCLCIYKPGPSILQHCSVIGKGKHETKVWPLSHRYKTHTTEKSIVWEGNVTLCSGKFVFSSYHEEPKPRTNQRGRGLSWQCPAGGMSRKTAVNWCLTACAFTLQHVHLSSLLMLLFCPVTMELIIALSFWDSPFFAVLYSHLNLFQQ